MTARWLFGKSAAGRLATGYATDPGDIRRTVDGISRVVHVPYTVEQDETGWFCAHAALPGGGANGEGRTRDEAIEDLRTALEGWFAAFGTPDELAVTVGVA